MGKNQGLGQFFMIMESDMKVISELWRLGALNDSVKEGFGEYNWPNGKNYKG